MILSRNKKLSTVSFEPSAKINPQRLKICLPRGPNSEYMHALIIFQFAAAKKMILTKNPQTTLLQNFSAICQNIKMTKNCC